MSLGTCGGMLENASAVRTLQLYVGLVDDANKELKIPAKRPEDKRQAGGWCRPGPTRGGAAG